MHNILVKIQNSFPRYLFEPIQFSSLSIFQFVVEIVLRNDYVKPTIFGTKNQKVHKR